MIDRIKSEFYEDGVLNQKKAIATLAVLIAILLLAILLVLKGVSDRVNMPERMAGHYSIESIKTDAEDGLSTEDLDAIKASGTGMTLDVYENGNAVMDVFGQQIKMTYDAKTKTMNIEGEEVPFKYSKDKITITGDDSVMVFAKETGA